MSKKVLLTATVLSHICQFHKPLAKMLQENGYEVHVAARDNLSEKNGLAAEYVDRFFNIPFERSPFSSENIKAYRELSKILKENDYEFIHCNTPVGGMVTRLAANKYRKKNGTKVFYTAHGFHFYEGAPKKNWIIYYPIEKFMSRFTDTLVTITTEDYNLSSKKFHCKVVHIHGVGANSAKFHVISDEEKASLKSELGYKENEKIILNVGELNANKNQATAIHAMKKVLEEYPDSKLLIAGNGDKLQSHKDLIKELDLNGSVELLGYTTEIFKYMNICDLLVACSFREGLPLNLMEAMLCGKPIIASNNRGHRELVDNGKNGFLVSVTNAEEYADKIIKVLGDSDYYVQNSLDKVEMFKDVNVLSELKDLYKLNE